MQKLRTFCAARLACLALLLALCRHGSAQVALPTNPLFAIEAVPFLSRFDAAVKAAGLDKTLSADTFEGTVFVPVDLAFDNLTMSANTTLDKLLADVPLLTKTLNYHIVPGVAMVPISGVRTGSLFATALGPQSQILVDNTVPSLTHLYGANNFATVLQYAQVKGNKAVVYVIDQVLQPPADIKEAPKDATGAPAAGVAAPAAAVPGATTAAAPVAEPAATPAAATPAAATVAEPAATPAAPLEAPKMP